MYVTSNNLKSCLDYKPYGHICHNDKRSSKTYFFCEACRTVSVCSKWPKAIVCPNCGYRYESLFLRYKYICYCGNTHNDGYNIRVLDSVTINHTERDDGTWKDINSTLWYRTYIYDANMKNQRSFTFYNRMTFNLETNQIYYTDNRGKGKDFHFAHFNVLSQCFYYDTEFDLVNMELIKILFDYYNKHFRLSGPKLLVPDLSMTSKLAFFCLKFPVLTVQYLVSVISSHSDGVDRIGNTIYYACNYDKVLREALTARSVDTYVKKIHEIYQVYVDYDGYKDEQILMNPLVTVYARYLYQLGFRRLSSAIRIANYWESVVLCDVFSVWILDVLRKRNHTRKKFFRRLIKQQGEDRVIDTFFDSRFTVTYNEFYFYQTDMNVKMRMFWERLSDACILESIDFRENCDVILREITWCK